LGCSAITLIGALEPAEWRTHPMASPGGPSLEHTDPDRILTPARGVRSVTKAPRAESDRAEPAIRDLDHGYLCACSAWPREGPFSTSVTCQAFRRDRLRISAGKSLQNPNWL